MNLSKSEGVWGNKEAIPHITKCDSRPLQQPETQPRNNVDWGKPDHVPEASPSQSPSVDINYLLLFVNSIISYGSSNRMVQNKRVFGSFCQAYPPSPRTHRQCRSIQQKYFPKIWRS